jgi:hypothetical protein
VVGVWVGVFVGEGEGFGLLFCPVYMSAAPIDPATTTTMRMIAVRIRFLFCMLIVSP